MRTGAKLAGKFWGFRQYQEEILMGEVRHSPFGNDASCVEFLPDCVGMDASPVSSNASRLWNGQARVGQEILRREVRPSSIGKDASRLRNGAGMLMTSS